MPRIPWPRLGIVLVDDGSTDGAVALIERRMTADPRIRVLIQAHRGKGAAVRRGMLAAQGAWRLMTDADLSVSPDVWPAFFDAAWKADAEVIVGLREAPGSRRIGEPVRVCRTDSCVSVTRGAAAFADVLRIRMNAWRGVYDAARHRTVAATRDKDAAS